MVEWVGGRVSDSPSSPSSQKAGFRGLLFFFISKHRNSVERSFFFFFIFSRRMDGRTDSMEHGSVGGGAHVCVALIGWDIVWENEGLICDGDGTIFWIPNLLLYIFYLFLGDEEWRRRGGEGGGEIWDCVHTQGMPGMRLGEREEGGGIQIQIEMERGPWMWIWIWIEWKSIYSQPTRLQP